MDITYTIMGALISTNPIETFQATADDLSDEEMSIAIDVITEKVIDIYGCDYVNSTIVDALVNKAHYCNYGSELEKVSILLLDISNEIQRRWMCNEKKD